MIKFNEEVVTQLADLLLRARNALQMPISQAEKDNLILDLALAEDRLRPLNE